MWPVTFTDLNLWCFHHTHLNQFNERRKNHNNWELNTAQSSMCHPIVVNTMGALQSHMVSDGCQCLIFSCMFTSAPLVCGGYSKFLCSSSGFYFFFNQLCQHDFVCSFVLSIPKPRGDTVSLSGSSLYHVMSCFFLFVCCWTLQLYMDLLLIKSIFLFTQHSLESRIWLIEHLSCINWKVINAMHQMTTLSVNIMFDILLSWSSAPGALTSLLETPDERSHAKLLCGRV